MKPLRVKVGAIEGIWIETIATGNRHDEPLAIIVSTVGLVYSAPITELKVTESIIDWIREIK